MKRWFAALPVHRKLVAMALAITLLALSAASAGLIALDVWRYRLGASTDITSLAQVIAENSAAALAFRDLEAAAETVATARIRPGVTRMCLYAQDGTLFAGDARDGGPPCPATPVPSQRWSVVSAEVPVLHNQRRLGMVFAERDLSDLSSRIVVTAGAGLITLVLAGLLAYGLAERLHRSVSTPIAQLAEAAQNVGTPSYVIPVIRANPDEIGDLVRALTGMMQRLQDANDGLVKEIDERRRIEGEREELLVREREASRLKDEFLAAVSHELRTPLNAITGWVHILKMGKTDPETLAKAVNTIGRNAHAQARVIEDLLDVSRIVTGKLHLELQAVDLRAPLEAAVEVVRPAAQARTVTIDVDVPTEACLVNGDSDRLHQVVSNLLSNAVKFSQAGGRVAVTLQEAQGAYEIRVRDTGIGISAEFLPHVFERFRQSDGSMTRGFGGLGLGLAIVKELTDRHGGVVRAESAGQGHGALFVVRVPRLLELDGTADGRVEPPRAPANLAKVRVLAVDDNPDALDVLAAALTDAGASVRVARAGAEAIELWNREPADVLICDLAMPQMDGFEVLRRIQLGANGVGVRALALSAHASHDYVDRSLAAGFLRHVSKPYARADLISAVADAAGRHG